MTDLTERLNTHDLARLISQATDEMAAEYDRIRRRTQQDPGTAGDQGEENWASLLRNWLPASLHIVTKGRIIATTGEASKQVDVLVLSPGYPNGLLNKKLYLAAGVLAAFECKNTLKREHIKKAVRTGAGIGEIARADVDSKHEIIYGLLAHSHAIASTRTEPENVISAALQAADEKEVQDPRDCLDYLCVANLGTWALMRQYFSFDAEEYWMTSYMGPWLTFGKESSNELPNHDFAPNPIGRFLTGLLRRLGEREKSIAPIAQYFDGVGLFGVGQGATRKWPEEVVPQDIYPFY